MKKMLNIIIILHVLYLLSCLPLYFQNIENSTILNNNQISHMIMYSSIREFIEILIYIIGMIFHYLLLFKLDKTNKKLYIKQFGLMYLILVTCSLLFIIIVYMTIGSFTGIMNFFEPLFTLFFITIIFEIMKLLSISIR